MSLRARSFLSFLFLLLLISAGLTACRRGALSPEQIHSITHDFESAAREAAHDQLRVTITEETARGGRILIAEHLEIVVRDSKRTTAVQEALVRVAESEGLAVDVKPSMRGTAPLVSLVCRRQGRITHTILLLAEPARVARRRAPGPQGELRAAILIDDLGYDNSVARELFSLRYPLNVSVLPALPHSLEMAEEAHRHRFEVLLHLPMDPLEKVGNHLEPLTLKLGMAPEEVRAIVERQLDAVPYRVGVNNHQGSRATADRALMATVMQIVKARHLYFVDSRTTADSVAYEVARESGVRTAYRTVFLDGPQGEPTREYALGQLRLLAEKVKQEGWGLAIGHPHRNTLAALDEYLPEFRRQGIQLVYLSQLVH